MASRMAEYERGILAVDLGRLPAIDAFRAVVKDLDRRLAKAEEVSVDATAAIQELRDRGLEIIAETIEPSVAAAQAATAQAVGYLEALQEEGLSGGLVALDPIEDLPDAEDAQTAFEALASGLAALAGVLAALDELAAAVEGKSPAGHTHQITAVDNLASTLAALDARKVKRGTAADNTPSSRISQAYGFMCDGLYYTKQLSEPSWVEVRIKVSGLAESPAGGTETRVGVQFFVLVGGTWTAATGAYVQKGYRVGNPTASEQGFYVHADITLFLDASLMETGGSRWGVAVQGAVVVAGTTFTINLVNAWFKEYAA